MTIKSLPWRQEPATPGNEQHIARSRRYRRTEYVINSLNGTSEYHRAQFGGAPFMLGRLTNLPGGHHIGSWAGVSSVAEGKRLALAIENGGELPRGRTTDSRVVEDIIARYGVWDATPEGEWYPVNDQPWPPMLPGYLRTDPPVTEVPPFTPADRPAGQPRGRFERV